MIILSPSVLIPPSTSTLDYVVVPPSFLHYPVKPCTRIYSQPDRKVAGILRNHPVAILSYDQARTVPGIGAKHALKVRLLVGRSMGLSPHSYDIHCCFIDNSLGSPISSLTLSFSLECTDQPYTIHSIPYLSFPFLPRSKKSSKRVRRPG